MNSLRLRKCWLFLLAVLAIYPASAQEPEKPAEQKSADEVARDLANPNNSLASLTFKNQYRWYKGDLPGADDQSNYTLLFQPVFPFKLAPRANDADALFFVRPAFPLVFDQPTFDGGKNDFDGVTALGDIGFDIGYGVTEKNGFIWAFGMVGTLPTATDSDIAGGQLRLGPEALFGKFETWGIYGVFPSHQWDVAGWNDDVYNNSQLQLFLIFLPGGGWDVGSTPIMNYDWQGNEWTIPLNLTVSRTVMLGKMPVKLSVEANYYVDRPDAFGSDWMIGLNITPVVPNIFEKWFRR